MCKICISATCVLFSICAEAQTIVLTCNISPVSDYFNKQVSTYENACKKYGARECANLEQTLKRRSTCEKSSLTYALKRQYVFEKAALSSLNESWAEVTFETCWGETTASRNLVRVTSTVISFIEGGDAFHVDRGTLVGGWGNYRAWSCNFKEVMVNNKL